MKEKKSITNTNTDQQLLKKLETVIELLSRDEIIDYIEILTNKKRRMYNQFLIGIAKGFGTAVGFTILGAVLVVTLRYVVLLNIPIIGDFIAEIVLVVQRNLQ